MYGSLLQQWLGKYLSGVTAAVILVSHEQEFIEKSCNHIAEVISCHSWVAFMVVHASFCSTRGTLKFL